MNHLEQITWKERMQKNGAHKLPRFLFGKRVFLIVSNGLMARINSPSKPLRGLISKAMTQQGMTEALSSE